MTAIPAITTLTGLNVQPESTVGILYNPANPQNIAISPAHLHGFYVPSLTTAQITTLAGKTEMRNGFIAYDNVVNGYRGYQNGALASLYSTVATAGVGLTSGSPVILPTGPSAAVEVAANQIAGFAYYNATAANIRVYANAGWHTVTIV